MSKAEEFIQAFTNKCSNECGGGYYDYKTKEKHPSYIPWLTPDQARKAVEIAREEILDEVCEWLKENTIKYITLSLSGEYAYGLQMQIFDDLRKAMKGDKE